MKASGKSIIYIFQHVKLSESKSKSSDSYESLRFLDY